MNTLELTRLEKAAADCGFERTPQATGNALVLRSNSFPESVSVQPLGQDVFVLTASGAGVLPHLEMLGASTPHASEAAPNIQPLTFTVQGWQALYRALDKAAANARTLPHRVAQKFLSQTANLPKSTEAERWVVQRVGQDLFRAALLDYWQGRCCVTGLAVPELLRASHIKPWALCDSDEERLDVFNGLLLAPHLDALFDGGWVTFAQTGAMLVAQDMSQEAMGMLGIHADLGIQGLDFAHQPYLEFHRQRVWRDAQGDQNGSIRS